MDVTAYNHNNVINFSLTPLFDGIKTIQSGAISIKRLYEIYRFLNILEKYINYAVVTKDDIDSVEEALEVIDDTIDDIEEMMDSANFIQKFLLKRILAKLLTIQFVLSNKLADYIGENHQN